MERVEETLQLLCAQYENLRYRHHNGASPWPSSPVVAGECAKRKRSVTNNSNVQEGEAEQGCVLKALGRIRTELQALRLLEREAGSNDRVDAFRSRARELGRLIQIALAQRDESSIASLREDGDCDKYYGDNGAGDRKPAAVRATTENDNNHSESGRKWRCDFCIDHSFESYEDCLDHEKECSRRSEEFLRSLTTTTAVERSADAAVPLNPLAMDLDRTIPELSPFHRVPSKKKNKRCSEGSPSRKRRKVLLTTVAPSSSASSSIAQSLVAQANSSLTLLQTTQQEEKKDIYSMAWSEIVDDDDDGEGRAVLLVTCSGRRLCLYRQRLQQGSKSGGLELECCFRDPDRKESFYSCVFAGRTQQRPYVPKQHQPYKNGKQISQKGRIIDKLSPEWESILAATKGPQLVCVGGEQRVIQVIDTVRKQIIHTLMGHGDAVYDLKVSPVDEWLLLSASRDESCRLWNLRTGSMVAVFGGHEGHRDAVNSVSWHSSGRQFASGGTDTRVKIWEFTRNVEKAIAASHQIADENEASKGQREERYLTGHTALVQYPIFSSNKVHVHCVDCIEFVGDLVMSKAPENMVKLWWPKIERQTTILRNPTVPPPSDVVLLRTFELEDCDDIWFVRFAMDPSKQILAAGNTQGVVYVWNIGARSREPFCTLRIKKRSSTIRYLSFSPDGTVLAASTHDGCIHRWSLHGIHQRVS